MTHDHAHNHRHDKKTLRIVLALNVIMFFVEIWQGIRADSSALLADSLDFLGDAFSYGMTLTVLDGHLHARARMSLVKAALMLLLATGAVTQGVLHFFAHSLPRYETMGWIGALALLANAICAASLYATRERDSNMRSIWLCSRNDVIANIAILAAAWLVYARHSLWPDLLVAFAIAVLGAASALSIVAQARQELKSEN